MQESAFPGLRRIATASNFVTAMRLLAAPLLALAIHAGIPRAALLLFALGVGTDFLDGWVARLLGEASNGGRTFDHATDAVFVAAGIGALALHGEAPLLLAPLVAAAFLQYALDSRAVLGQALRASALGRANGIAYYVLLGIPLVRDSLALAWPGQALVQALGWLLVATTLLSMADRLRALLAGRPRRDGRGQDEETGREPKSSRFARRR